MQTVHFSVRSGALMLALFGAADGLGVVGGEVARPRGSSLSETLEGGGVVGTSDAPGSLELSQSATDSSGIRSTGLLSRFARSTPAKVAAGLCAVAGVAGTAVAVEMIEGGEGGARAPVAAGRMVPDAPVVAATAPRVTGTDGTRSGVDAVDVGPQHSRCGRPPIGAHTLFFHVANPG